MDGQDVIAFTRDAARNPHTGTIINKIEDILENIVDALSENRVLTIPLRSRHSGNVRLIRFPANTNAEVKRFTCLLQILHICHEALVSGHLITKRSVYYQNPDLFGSQQYVDHLVDDIAFTFGFGRNSLNIVAAYKGLIAGAIVITLNDDSTLDCSSGSNDTLIPHAEAIQRLDMARARWIMIIEKEATFRGLAASRYFELSAAGVGILVTGKGYPDLVTRQLLHMFRSSFPHIPIYALVDFDPSGIEIMLTYKRGSRSLRHELNVTIPELSWLGPKIGDILCHCHHVYPTGQHIDSTPPSSPNSSLSFPPHSRVQSANSFGVSSHLTASDRRKAEGLLRKLGNEQGQGADKLELAHELQMMLVLNVKAEIQAVDDAGNISRWLDEKLLSRRQ